MRGLTTWYIKIGEFGLNLFLLNLLWCLFTVLGLFVLGLFPATAALFAVMRKLIMEDEEAPIFKIYWSSFKREFIKSNIIGYIFLIIGFILYVDYRVLQQLDTNFFHLFLTVITLIVSFLFIMMSLYIFPLLVHFNLKTIDYTKYAFALTVGRPLQSIMLLILLAILIVLFMQLPGLIPVFGVSLVSFVVMKVAARSLPEIKSSH